MILDLMKDVWYSLDFLQRAANLLKKERTNVTVDPF